MEAAGYTFVIGYDPDSKHELVDGKYAHRQRICFASLPILSQLLGRTVTALGEVSVDEFDTVEKDLIKRTDETTANYVRHIVADNDRVHQGIKLLQ